MNSVLDTILRICIKISLNASLHMQQLDKNIPKYQNIVEKCVDYSG